MNIAFKTNVENMYGDRGRLWLANLPQIVAKAADEYALSELKAVDNLSYNYVLIGLQRTNSGQELPIILKIGFNTETLNREATALKAFAGCGTVEVLAESNGVLLLESAIPGVSLRTYFPERDTEATRVVCTVMQRLHQAPLPTTKFPHIKEWLMAIDKAWDIPARYLQKARRLRDQLLHTSAPEILLHADLHHDNILTNGNGFVVIDPHGVIGEPCYECAAFIRNPLPELLTATNVTDIISRRIVYFANSLGLEPQRILDWCFVQAVLAWVWTLEDGGDKSNFVMLAEIFDTLVLEH